MQARRSLDTFLSRRFGSFPKCPKAALTSRPYRPLHKPAAISTTRVASTCESQQCGAQCNLEASRGDDHARSVGARSYCHAPDDLGNRCRHYTCAGPPRRKLFKHGVQHAIVLHMGAVCESARALPRKARKCSLKVSDVGINATPCKLLENSLHALSQTRV